MALCERSAKQSIKDGWITNIVRQCGCRFSSANKIHLREVAYITLVAPSRQCELVQPPPQG